MKMHQHAAVALTRCRSSLAHRVSLALAVVRRFHRGKSIQKRGFYVGVHVALDGGLSFVRALEAAAARELGLQISKPLFRHDGGLGAGASNRSCWPRGR